MKSVSEQFQELVVARKPAAKKHEMSLVSKHGQPGPNELSSEDCKELLHSELELLTNVAFDLKDKLGGESAPEICKAFSQHVRTTVAGIKDSIKSQGRPSLATEKILDSEVTDKLSKTLDRIKRAG